MLLVHHLDDFLHVYSHNTLRTLVKARFLISLKSVLELVIMFSFVGKALNLSNRSVECHTQALLQLWVGLMRLAVVADDRRGFRNFLGLLNRHVRPRGLGCLFVAGAWCWLRWGTTLGGERQPSRALPLKFLQWVGTVMALAAKAWSPSGNAWAHARAFHFGSETCVSPLLGLGGGPLGLCRWCG